MGMNALQGTFPKFKAGLSFCKVKRGLVLQAIGLIHNLRAELVGLNQIDMVLNNPEYQQTLIFRVMIIKIKLNTKYDVNVNFI